MRHGPPRCLARKRGGRRELIKLEQAARQVQVQLRWVPGHRGVEGNELAEHGTRETAPIRYLSAVNDHLQKQMHERWASNAL
jgi:ribonuclease HI